jgi:hypothetical protein
MRILILSAALASAAMLSACGTTTTERVSSGALGGAVVGAAVDHSVGGAVVGGAVGAATGLAVDAADRR